MVTELFRCLQAIIDIILLWLIILNLLVDLRITAAGLLLAFLVAGLVSN